MKRNGSAPGKIILSGEYAVVFGYPGIAVPSSLSVETTFEKDLSLNDIKVKWYGIIGKNIWKKYVEEIVDECITLGTIPPGILTIENGLPLGKGMGASTAFVIAITRCLLGKDTTQEARMIEDTLNPGHSGIDFAVIWNNEPLLFRKDEDPKKITLPDGLLDGAFLIDTGEPKESTSELVAWITKRRDDLTQNFKTIANCTERLTKGEDLAKVMRDHHQAQVALGVVPENVQELISMIEDKEGSAKVIGAGGKNRGGGMVLALGLDQDDVTEFPVLSL